MYDWYNRIQKAKKSCMQTKNLRKVRYEFENGQEMVEEYNMDTKVLTRRAWRVNHELGSEGNWDIEVGDPEPSSLKADTFIKENSTQPFMTRRVTKTSLEWRIRNLPYPIETYSVAADRENKCLTVRTTNKKYFKKIPILELERAHLLPEQSKIEVCHKFNTLIITYKKPEEFLALEKAIFDEVLKLTPKDEGQMGDCKPS